MAKRRKPGRPKLPKDQQQHVVAVRLTPPDLWFIDRAAKQRKETRSAWMRATLIAAAELECLQPIESR
jgi:uncharacterized protein (DUF1778 family)